MKVILAADKLIGEEQKYTGDEIEVSDEEGAYMISMGSAKAAGPKELRYIDQLDEAVAKDNPFLVGPGIEGDDHPENPLKPKKGKK